MEDVNWLRFLLAFIFVLGLLGVFAYALRRWGGGWQMARAKSHRLQVVEMRALGPRHRLALVRRDGAEHLLLLGPESACVVESGIKREGV